MRTCTNCNGRKWGFDMMLNERECPTCRGRGYIIEEEKARTTNENVSQGEGEKEE